MSNRANASCRSRGIAGSLLAVVLALCACLVWGGAAAVAASLPDGRAYELVTPLEKNGLEVGAGIPSTDGNAVDWQAPGGCCGASTAAQTLYQSSRTSGGWQTKALTPTPSRPLVGLTEEQNPVFWTSDLSQTIFSTPASYATGDERPSGSGALDLYLQGPSGSMDWLSQGPFAGSGSAADSATFDGATPDASHVVFSSAAQLTEDATGGNQELGIPPQLLYERDVAGAKTQLVNVYSTTLTANSGGRVTTTLTAAATGTTTSGLTVGVGPAVATELTAAATAGETTIAVASTEGIAAGEPVTIDTGGAEETATVAAALDPTELLLTTGLSNDHATGAPVAHAADSSIAVGSTEGFAAGQSVTIGEEAASVAEVTDGTHLALSAPLASAHGEGTQVTHTGDTTIAVASSEGLRAGEPLRIDTGEAQEATTIASVPDGSHLTLDGPLAESHAAGANLLYAGDTTIAVASTEGFIAGRQITVDTGAASETATIEAVPDATHLLLSAGLSDAHSVGAQVAGLVDPDGAVLGDGAPLGNFQGAGLGTTTNAISSDGSKVFFESPPPVGNANGGSIAHLYMRNLDTDTTTPLDNPAYNQYPQATARPLQYEGAAKDGSLVFFTSHEALAGEPVELEPVLTTHNFESDNELYEFNTTTHQIGTAPPMSVAPASGGGFSPLATALTSEAHGRANTELTVGIQNGEDPTSITVGSTVGFAPGETIEIGEPSFTPCAGRFPLLTIVSVTDATHLVLNTPVSECAPATSPVTYAGETSLSLASTAGFIVGEQVEVEGEQARVESIPDATHLVLDHAMQHSHPAGAALISSTKPGDGDVIGETAIANDGSRVYFVAEGVLSGANSQGQTPTWHEPNLYVFDTASGKTTFIAKVAWPDVSDCLPTCGEGNPSGLVAEPDVDRPAVPTPDGSVLVFDSSANLTGQDPGPASTLSAAATPGQLTLAVGSTAGFAKGRTVTIGTGATEELAIVESVDDATHLTLSESAPAGGNGLERDHAAGAPVTELHSELYRYDADGESLACVSCTPAGVTPTGSATLGAAGGGSYGPADTAVPMNESGSEIFFQTPDPLVSGDVNGGSFANGPFGSTAESSDVYEWENGKVSLISNGHSTPGATLDGTTPSGNDVFLTTLTSLVSSDGDGFGDIYDARVGGGFAEPATGPAPCSGQNCRPRGASVFFSVPASATLTGKGNVTPLSVSAPSFSVAAITASEKAKAAKSGALTLSVSATAAGKISANASATVNGKAVKAASASVSLGGAGKASLTLHLSTAARKALAKKGKLALRVEVSYSESGTVKIATLTLKRAQTKARKKGKKAAVRRAAAGEAAVGRVGAGGPAVSPAVRGRGRGA